MTGSIAAIGAGLAVLGVGFGIGKIQTAMIIAAALIEGAGLFGIVVAMLGNG